VIDLSITPADGPEVKLAKATLAAMRIQAVPPAVQAEAMAIAYAALIAEACLGKPWAEQMQVRRAAWDMLEAWLTKMHTALSH